MEVKMSGTFEGNIKQGVAYREMVAVTHQPVDILVSEAKDEGTIVASHANKYPLEGLNELKVMLIAKTENIVATDTLTFKFYKRQEVDGVTTFSEIYQSANYTVLTTGVTAGQCKIFTVDDADEIIKHATHFSVATTAGIAIPADGYGVMLVGKSLAV
jgi:hypothetical protein